MRVLLLTALLGACAMADPRGLVALARLDPLSADPGEMVLQLDLPEGLAVRSASLSIEATSGARTAAARAAILPGPGGLWRVSEADLPAWREATARIRAWKAEDPDGTSGSLTVSADGCTQDPGPAPGARVTVALQPSPGAPFAPILTRAPIARLLGELPPSPCPAGG